LTQRHYWYDGLDWVQITLIYRGLGGSNWRLEGRVGLWKPEPDRCTSVLGIGVVSCGAVGHMSPLVFQQFIVSFHFGTAQSLTATLRGYPSKHFKLEAILRWSAICRMWPWTLTYQKFLLCFSSQDQDLYSDQKLSENLLVLIWERLQTPKTTTTDAAVQPLGRYIVCNSSCCSLVSAFCDVFGRLIIFTLRPSFVPQMPATHASRAAYTYGEDVREVAERDFCDADGRFRHVVRNDGRTEQLAIADRRKMNVEYDAVVDSQTHQLQQLRQGSSTVTYIWLLQGNLRSGLCGKNGWNVQWTNINDFKTLSIKR